VRAISRRVGVLKALRSRGFFETGKRPSLANRPSRQATPELLVGEVRPDVACRAVAFAAEDSEAELLLVGECAAIAVHVAIKRRIAGKDAPHIARERARRAAIERSLV